MGCSSIGGALGSDPRGYQFEPDHPSQGVRKMTDTNQTWEDWLFETTWEEHWPEKQTLQEKARFLKNTIRYFERGMERYNATLKIVSKKGSQTDIDRVLKGKAKLQNNIDRAKEEQYKLSREW